MSTLRTRKRKTKDAEPSANRGSQSTKVFSIRVLPGEALSSDFGILSVLLVYSTAASAGANGPNCAAQAPRLRPWMFPGGAQLQAVSQSLKVPGAFWLTTARKMLGLFVAPNCAAGNIGQSATGWPVVWGKLVHLGIDVAPNKSTLSYANKHRRARGSPYTPGSESIPTLGGSRCC
jgi:hypothetical protein